MTTYKGRGRPRKTDAPHTPAPPKKYDLSHRTNLNINKNLRTELNALAAELEQDFGFRPTHGQILIYLINLHKERRRHD